jgi:hypothetical protein
MKIHDARYLCDWRIIYRLAWLNRFSFRRVTCKRCLRRRKAAK